MYSWIWRMLPGGLPGRLIGSLLLLTGVLALLWFVIFPWAEPLLPFDDVQVGTGTEQSGPAQQDPNAVPGDDSLLGPDEIPYDEQSNEPHPSAS